MLDECSNSNASCQQGFRDHIPRERVGSHPRPGIVTATRRPTARQKAPASGSLAARSYRPTTECGTLI